MTGSFGVSIKEASATSYSKSGSLSFSDADVSDILSVGVVAQSVAYRTTAGVDLLTRLTSAQIASLASAFSFTSESLASNSGVRNWTYAAPDSALDFLASGEVLTLTSTISASDQNGGVTTKDVVITLTGTNDGPVIQSSATSSVFASVAESVGKSADATVSTRQGSVKFSDLDLNDTHTVSAVAKDRGYAGTLTASIATDSTGAKVGEVVWTYSVADKALDFLSAGQQVTQVYTLTIADGKGGSVQQDVSVLLTGTNDVPTIAIGTGFVISENSAASYTRTGAITFADADLNDRLLTSIDSQSLVWKSATGVDISYNLTAEQRSAIVSALSIPLGELGSNKGTANWTFNIADASLDFLGRLETLTFTTVVKADDHNGGTATKNFAIVFNGGNDTPAFEALAPTDPKIAARFIEGATSGSQTSQGALAFTDLDVTDVHTLGIKALGTRYLGNFSSGLVSDTTGGHAGSVGWTFSVADKAMDFLAAGQVVTQTYALTVSDAKGGVVTQNVSIDLVGTNDAPVVTGVATGTLIQDPLHSTLGTTIVRSGTLSIADVDATDRLSITPSAYEVHYFNSSGIDLSTLPSSSLTIEQAASLAQAKSLAAYLTVTPTTVANTGQISWNYSVDPAKVNFLHAGEKVTISTQVAIQDIGTDGQAAGSAVLQPISVTLVGSNSDASVKNYLSSIVDQTFLSKIPADFTIGIQTPVDQLTSYKALTPQDGFVFKPPITLNVTKDGATFDGIDFRGMQIVVEADNVTFTNCLFDSSGTQGAGTIAALATADNLTIDHSTFDGLKLNINFPSFISSRGTNATISNNIFKNVPSDAMYIENGTVVGNYFSTSGYYSNAHADAIWIAKTTGAVVIENNVIDWRTPADARTGTNNAIRISGEAGDVDNVTIKNNVLLGGNYTITVTQGATWTHTAYEVGKITNINILDNVIDLGKTGSVDIMDRPTTLQIAGNERLNGSGTKFGSASIADLPNLAALTVIGSGVGASTVLPAAVSAYILGGNGSDHIAAGTGGLNVIQGGVGRDFIAGGTGTNIFVYKTIADEDWITRFNDATDRFDISSLVELQGRNLTAADWRWLGTDAFTGTALQINYTYNSSLDRTLINFDINGDLNPDFRIQVSGRHSFTQGQFILEHATKTTSVLGSLWSGAGFDTATSTLTAPFTFANAPLVIRNGIVALQDSDGTLLQIGGMKTYKFLDATIVQNSASPLVDDLYYNVKYHALFASPVDASADYATSGWAAGRDPNAFFSTSGYLALHADVAAANGNPLDHWSSIGWRLGYDPSASFDVKTYALRYLNSATQVDPLTDYLTGGRAAGRVAYGAIGDSVRASGFDADYYLLAHPDVAASGMDPYLHYQTIGWKAGYNPNAFFDVSYYLSQNPSVAASGVDPLQDFMNGGWQLGRSPSASFDMALYLAANPDVAASGMNPLLHFLQVGANEGRWAFTPGSTLTSSAPVVVGESVIATSGLAVDVQSGVLANDTDPDGDALSVIAVAHDGFKVATVVHGQYGDLTLNANGSYFYTVTNATGAVGAPLIDHFNYVVSDKKGSNSSADLNIRVDRASIVQDDEKVASVASGNSVAVDKTFGVLANDSDADGTLRVVSINGSAVGLAVVGLFGTLTMGADGSYTYTRTAGTLPANAVDSFAYSVSDGLGGDSKAALLTIKVADAPLNANIPTISGDGIGRLTEGSSITSASGVLSVQDGDSGDRLVVSVDHSAVQFTDASGADRSGLLDASTVSALKAGFALSGGAIGSNAGTAGWSYGVGPGVLDFLGRGESAQVVTSVRVDDGQGGTALKDVVVTLTGVDDAAVFAAPVAPTVVSEPSFSTGSPALVTRQGTVGFSDLDLTDVHSVSVSTSGAGRGYIGSLVASVTSDTTGGRAGTVTWTFSAPEKAMDFLGDGQSQDQTYTLALSDGKGGIVRQDVVVTLVGTDDLPKISGSSSASWYEGGATSYQRSGVLSFLDPDLTDHVTTSIQGQSVSYVTAKGVDMSSSLSLDQLSALKAAFSMPVGDLGSNKGSSSWTYGVLDKTLDFLGQNDVVNVVTRVKASDGHGGEAFQDVTITVKGINDAPVLVSPGTAVVTGAVAEAAGVSGSASLHATTGSFQFADADLSDAHLLRVTAKGPGYLGTFTPVVTQDTTGGGTGTVSWTFQVADKALDGLAAGQTVTQTYSVLLHDGKTGGVTQDIVVTLTGASDQFSFATPTARALPSFAAGDTLAVSASSFGGGLAAGALDASWFSDTAGATVSGHGQFFQDATHKSLLWDADGTGSKAPVTIATFASAQDIHYSDILVL